MSSSEQTFEISTPYVSMPEVARGFRAFYSFLAQRYSGGYGQVSDYIIGQNGNRVRLSSEEEQEKAYQAWVRLAYTSLKSIDIPESVYEISGAAFRGCTSLETVVIPRSINNWYGIGIKGGYTFADCTSLKNVTIECGDLNDDIGWYEGLSWLDTGCFQNCTSLESITLPASFEGVMDYAFDGCSALVSIDLPEALTSIGAYAFRKCTGLTELVVKNSVTTIGSYAFEECSTLSTVYCEPTTPPTLGYGAFAYNAENRVIYVPASAVSAYQSKWSTYKNVIFAGSF
jgi:hypothetical protein